MILTDREIQIALQVGTIVIEPEPADQAYSSTSVDLTLDPMISEFIKPQTGIDLCIDPSSAGYKHDDVLRSVTRQVEIDGTNGYEFRPGKLVLAWSREYVKLHAHARLAARVEGKSSLARLGIAVHVTAPTIHSGFDGQIRLEMINHGAIPVKLRLGMRICQLIFEQTGRGRRSAVIKAGFPARNRVLPVRGGNSAIMDNPFLISETAGPRDRADITRSQSW